MARGLAVPSAHGSFFRPEQLNTCSSVDFKHLMSKNVQVGGTSWPLERTTPTLKSADYTYVFAINGGTAFYSVILSTGELLARLLTSTGRHACMPASDGASNLAAASAISHI
jgi:hypothetical protein